MCLLYNVPDDASQTNLRDYVYKIYIDADASARRPAYAVECCLPILDPTRQKWRPVSQQPVASRQPDSSDRRPVPSNISFALSRDRHLVSATIMLC